MTARLIPSEPTEAMLKAGMSISPAVGPTSVYRAMFRAAPDYQPTEEDVERAARGITAAAATVIDDADPMTFEQIRDLGGVQYAALLALARAALQAFINGLRQP